MADKIAFPRCNPLSHSQKLYENSGGSEGFSLLQKKKMTNKASRLTNFEEAYPLKGELDNDRQQNRSCFLSPFLCGTNSRIIAYVHLLIMGLISFSVFAIFLYVVTLGIHSVVNALGVIGMLIGLIPLILIAIAFYGVLKKKGNCVLPLVVHLCFLGITFTIFTASGMYSLHDGDNNLQPLVVVLYAISITYISHAVRVLLRARLDLLEEAF